MSSEPRGPIEVRINELARELEVKAKAIIDLLPGYGITEKKTHSGSIPVAVAEKIRQRILEQERAAASPRIQSHTPASPAVSGPLPNIPLRRVEPVVLKLPRKFAFHRRGFVDFGSVLACFDWSLRNVPVQLDITTCESTDYQALALLVQYAWLLRMRGCNVGIKYGLAGSGPTRMLSRMGALDWPQVLTMDGRNFGDRPGQTLALRRRADVQNTINIARRVIQDYKVGFPEYLSYIISELLYNATEHGARIATIDDCQVRVPSVFQFGRYPFSGRLVFFSATSGSELKLTSKKHTRHFQLTKTRSFTRCVQTFRGRSTSSPPIKHETTLGWG
jgi:hypothetical protein